MLAMVTRRRGVRPELPHEQRERESRQQPATQERQDQQPGRDGQDVTPARSDPSNARRHTRLISGVSTRFSSTVTRYRTARPSRIATHSTSRIPPILAVVRKRGQHAAASFERDLLVHRRNRVERLAREQPDRPVVAARQPLHDDLDVPVVADDRANDLQAGLRDGRAGPFGRVAQLFQPGGQAGVEDDEQLVRQLLGRLTGEPRIQVLTREIVVAFAGGDEKSQHRAARRAAAERVLRRFGLRRGRGRCRRRGSRNGLGSSRARSHRPSREGRRRRSVVVAVAKDRVSLRAARCSLSIACARTDQRIRSAIRVRTMCRLAVCSRLCNVSCRSLISPESRSRSGMPDRRTFSSRAPSPFDRALQAEGEQRLSCGQARAASGGSETAL